MILGREISSKFADLASVVSIVSGRTKMWWKYTGTEGSVSVARWVTWIRSVGSDVSIVVLKSWATIARIVLVSRDAIS